MTTVLTARTPHDLVELIPHVLGFTPEDSMVMLTFGADRPFHARTNLAEPDEVDEVAALLVNPCVKHKVERVVLFAYTDDPDRADCNLNGVAPAFLAAGMVVVETMQVDIAGGRMRPVGEDFLPIEATNIALPAMVKGSAPRPDRQAILDSMARVSDAVISPGVTLVKVSDVPAGVDTWDVPTDDQVRAIVAALPVDALRDKVTGSASLENARERVSFWTGIMRRCPEGQNGHVAAQLALAAWLAGDGATAWCAIDSADEITTLADLLGQCLTNAVPPHEWSTFSTAYLDA